MKRNDAGKLEDVAARICWNAEGKGRLRAQGQRVPFSFESEWIPAKKQWKMEMQVPLKGSYTAWVDYAAVPEGQIRWRMDSGEHVPTAAPEEWKQAFLLLGRALWASTPGLLPLPMDQGVVRTDGSDKARLIYSLGQGRESILELQRPQEGYFRNLRLIVGPASEWGRPGPSDQGAELILQVDDCRPL